MICGSIILSALIVVKPLYGIHQNMKQVLKNCKELNDFFNRQNKPPLHIEPCM